MQRRSDRREASSLFLLSSLSPIPVNGENEGHDRLQRVHQPRSAEESNLFGVNCDHQWGRIHGPEYAALGQHYPHMKRGGEKVSEKRRRSWDVTCGTSCLDSLGVEMMPEFHRTGVDRSREGSDD